jgi:hypothetical protein
MIIIAKKFIRLILEYKIASSIYDSTYAWRDNILTAAASLALPSYGSHYSGVSSLA